MDGILLGLVTVAAGIFVCVYGNLLFRFVMAVLGFVIGFWLIMVIFPTTNDALRIILAIVVGGIGAAILYSLFRLALHVAGALLGAVVVMAILALVGWVGHGNFGVFSWILVIAGAAVVGFFGNRLGDAVISLATALAGAAAVVAGLSKLFSGVVATSGDPIMILANGFAFVLFLVIAIISALAQLQIADLRRRLLRR
jgi:hypothetical protein